MFFFVLINSKTFIKPAVFVWNEYFGEDRTKGTSAWAARNNMQSTSEISLSLRSSALFQI